MYTITFMAILLLNLAQSQAQPCSKYASVNISDGEMRPNGVIMKDKIEYYPNNYYDEKGVKWGCICNIKPCIQKCCEEGKLWSNGSCVEHANGQFNISLYDNTDPVNGEYFRIVYFDTCGVNSNPSFLCETGKQLHVQMDGSLLVNSSYSLIKTRLYGAGNYCLTASEMEAGVLRAMVCNLHINLTDLIIKLTVTAISLVLLLVTFIVYAFLPNLNLHKKTFMAYILVLMLLYILRATRYLEKPCPLTHECYSIAFIKIFLRMALFYWMNIICIDTWWAFNGVRSLDNQKHGETRRFNIYCVYAFGMPLLHVIIIFLANILAGPKTSFYPDITANGRCFLKRGIPFYVYFAGPILILTGVNIVLFVLTVRKIRQVKKEMSVLKRSKSYRCSQEDVAKLKLSLYLKLFLAMGVNWSVYAIQRFLNLYGMVYSLLFFSTSTHGVLIFYMFVFKEGIWKSVKGRFCKFLRRANSANPENTDSTDL